MKSKRESEEKSYVGFESYVESEKEREYGHEDTRSKNFECEEKDPHLGCDLGIDVAG